MTPDDSAERTELQELLAAERAHTLDQIAILERGFASIVESTALSATDDEHDPEGVTIGFERGQLSAVLDSTRRHLSDIDQALVRLGEGSYGRCERCGAPIAHGRLLARPAARRCIACADLGPR